MYTYIGNSLLQHFVLKIKNFEQLHNNFFIISSLFNNYFNFKIFNEFCSNDFLIFGQFWSNFVRILALLGHKWDKKETFFGT